MVRHVENPGMVKIVYSNIFRHIERHSAVFSHVQAYWGTSKHIETIKALLRHIASYSEIFSPLCNPSLYNCGLFKIFRMIRHNQSPGIVRTVYLIIFKDIYGYSGILSAVLCAKCFILNVRQCSEFAFVSITA